MARAEGLSSRGAAFALALAAGALLAGGAGAAPPRPSPRPQLEPAPGISGHALLRTYREAVANLLRPPNVTFNYSVSRSGPKRAIAEDHRVYRDAAGNERNETIAVNGSKLTPARARIFRRAAWPYDVGKFLLPADGYDTRLLGLSKIAGRRVYAFAVKRRARANFSIDGLYIDEQRLLPVRETFTAAGGGCAGSGSIDFGPIAGYWLVTGVSAACSTSDGSKAGRGPVAPPVFRERIRFWGYQFPRTLPSQVFGASQSSPGLEPTPGP